MKSTAGNHCHSENVTCFRSTRNLPTYQILPPSIFQYHHFFPFQLSFPATHNNRILSYFIFYTTPPHIPTGIYFTHPHPLDDDDPDNDREDGTGLKKQIKPRADQHRNRFKTPAPDPYTWMLGPGSYDDMTKNFNAENLKTGKELLHSCYVYSCADLFSILYLITAVFVSWLTWFAKLLNHFFEQIYKEETNWSRCKKKKRKMQNGEKHLKYIHLKWMKNLSWRKSCRQIVCQANVFWSVTK